MTEVPPERQWYPHWAIRERRWFRGLMSQFGTKVSTKTNYDPGFYDVLERRGWKIDLPYFDPVVVWLDPPLPSPDTRHFDST
jgi:hypothetical protein